MWGDTLYFIPIALTTSGDVIGENQSGDGEVWGEGIDWLEYKDPTPPEQEYILVSKLTEGILRSQYPLQVVLKRDNFDDIEAELWIKVPK